MQKLDVFNFTRQVYPSRFLGQRVPARVVRSISTTVLLTCMLLLSQVNAQLYTGSVSGIVTDSSGAVIQAAQVMLVDAQKGFEFKATTDSSGRYLFRQVAPGTYALSVDAQNFQSQRKEGVSLAINQNASADFALQVGAAALTVDVRAAGVELQTQDAVTGQVVDRRFINDLPLISRNVFDLAFLAPGVTIADNQCVGCTATNFVSNGSRNSTADVVIDGVTTSNFEQNSGIMSATYTPSVEAVEEFKVQQSNFSAEFGFSGASVVNVVTRSGGNDFHGSLYEFLRNDKLDANDWFANRDGSARAPLRRNNFGFTIGGPIKKNKTFFFFDYDGLRERSFSSGTAGVPTELERAGNFGEVCSLRDGASFDDEGRCNDPAGQLWDPYDPNAFFDDEVGGFHRTAFIPFNDLTAYASQGTANPNVAGNLIDPVAFQLMQKFPLPTSTDDRFRNWFRSGTNQSTDNKFDIKIDHRISQNNLISGRYSHEWGNFHSFNCYGSEADPCTGGPVDFNRHLFAFNETVTFSPSLIMNISYGYTRGFDFQKGIQGDFPDIDPTSLGLPAYMKSSGFNQFPDIVLADYNAPQDGANIGTQTFSILRQGQDTHHLVGTLSWVRGAHEFKFGGEGRMHRINFAQPGWPAGEFNFDINGSSEFRDSGGDSLASFMMGVGSPDGCFDFCPYEVPNSVSTQNFQFGGFVQDNWKLNSKLTLNLGLRYDVTVPRTERFNRQNWLDLNATNPLNGGSITYDDPITGDSVTRPLLGAEVFSNSRDRYNFGIDWKEIQPRFGFAYQVHPNVVLRGGYGIFYSTTRAGAAGTGPINTYKGYDQLTEWVTVDPANQVTPFARLSDPFPGGPLQPPGNTLGALNDVGFGGGGNVKAITDTPYEQTWTFGLETQLPGKIVLETNYVGKKGTHLYYGGASELNHLPVSIEDQPASVIQSLTNSVPNPFFGIITDPLSPLSATDIQASQLLLPYPQYTSLQGDTFPFGSSIYHAFQARLEKEYRNGLQFLLTYTWAKSIDDSSTTDDSVSWLGGSSSLQDPNRRYLERSVSQFDVPHLLQFSYVYELPVGRGRKIGGAMNSVANAVIGGWQLNGTFTFSSGRPIQLSLDSGQAIPTYGNRRPNLVATLKRNSGSSSVDQYFSNADQVVQEPADFALGNAPRALSNIRQPGVKNATMSLFKEFPLSKLLEGSRLEFRVEAFNAFNHPQFCGPDTSVRFVDGAIEQGTFGVISSTCNSAREVQLGLKLYW
jgi:hypothetical protein